ncbi:MAG: fasciclin domain-containing protein [Phycisphaerales bacterium]
MTKQILACMAVFALAGSVIALEPEKKAEPAKTEPVKAEKKAEGKTIAETAMGTGMHNTLVAALKAAGWVEPLKGNGPFTVFAPTDEAFAKLPKATLDSLMEPQNKEKLANILKFHVIQGKAVKAETVVTMTESVPTLQGQTFKIMAKDGKVTIGNDVAMANVIKTDVICSNGVIHVIDTVLMPASDGGKTEGKKDEKKPK